MNAKNSPTNHRRADLARSRSALHGPSQIDHLLRDRQRKVREAHPPIARPRRLASFRGGSVDGGTLSRTAAQLGLAPITIRSDTSYLAAETANETINQGHGRRPAVNNLCCGTALLLN